VAINLVLTSTFTLFLHKKLRMKKYIVYCLFAISFIGNAQEKWTIAQAQASQKKLNEEYADPKESPLKETDLKYTFDTKTNGAFAGMSEAASFTYQAVNAAYAGLSDEVGDTSGEFNQKRYMVAMEMVTGSKDGAIDAFNSKIIPPYGMPEDVFIDRVDTEFKRQIEVNNLPIDPSMINDYKIIPLDYGVYGFVDGNDIKPIVVNLNTVQSLMP